MLLYHVEDCFVNVIYFLFFLFILCYQTDGSVPNTLVIANCEVVKPRVATAEYISKVIDQFQSPKPLFAD